VGRHVPRLRIAAFPAEPSDPDDQVVRPRAEHVALESLELVPRHCTAHFPFGNLARIRHRPQQIPDQRPLLSAIGLGLG
jgi:hypothetical protein